MCILCVIQKWSRRVATMLPWLVVPLIGLWALSQLLPPAFRFEITSPRLACVFVLLVTLFWYEILMPQLSAWRVRRNARLRERKRFEAIEFQKLRKTATRRCRNCLTPYRDQNPGGGRFMCSYCGHISKRPVLDLPVPPGLGISHTRIIKDLVGKSGKILNGRVWSDNGWICGQDWSENGNWVGGSIPGKSGSWRKSGSDLFGGDEHCLTENSYSGIVIFAGKLLTSFLLSIRWLWRKISRVSSSSEECSSDADLRGILAKRGENGVSLNESRGEKARRKAEEKRQARLEKELLEEEERKQREEVARLVEERRRLRDEKLEAEKDHSKSVSSFREKGSKKEAEKRRQEKKKEKDKGSSKSNSDAEELEKRASKESERKQDFDKKSEIDRREHKKFDMENVKGQGTDVGLGVKNISVNNYNRGNSGTRYLDRMRGTILSSSKAFSFGKGPNITAAIMKENKFNSSVDHVHTSANRRDLYAPERVNAKTNMNGDDKNISPPVHSEPQPWTTPTKTWQQLFTRSSSVPQNSNANVISRPHTKFEAEVLSPTLSVQSPLTQSFDNPVNFGLPSPFNLSTYPNVSTTSSSLGFSPAIEPIFAHAGEVAHQLIAEEQDLFEDPCYVPDPLSLLGPVSESLDNFQLDLGTGFMKDMEMERPHALKSISSGSETNKPSPIESPMSREKHNNSNRLPSTPKAQNMDAFSVDDVTANEKGTWQMWSTSPLGQDGLGLVCGPASWLLPSDRDRSNKDDFVIPSSQKNMASLFTKEDNILSGTPRPNFFLGHGQKGGTFNPITVSNDHDPWLQSAFFPPLSGNESNFSLKPQEVTTQNEMVFGSPSSSVNNHPFETSPANGWSKQERPLHGSGEGIGKSPVARPQIGGLYPTPDVQSLWSFD
ncbi:Stress response NST1-like protein [Quillaja saponaria]|uniref:Stress response NST1-like protein n=1 Tax=Quillaja saponaria TaxID=32244 RepID=A0AAD7PML1_QUISA|nr:Stress response NST1-like protein [Quillaja saponaria]